MSEASGIGGLLVEHVLENATVKSFRPFSDRIEVVFGIEGESVTFVYRVEDERIALMEIDGGANLANGQVGQVSIS